MACAMDRAMVGKNMKGTIGNVGDSCDSRN